MKKSLALMLLLFAVLPLSAGENLVNIQGRLTDSSGNNLTGNQTLTFRLYQSSGDAVAAAVWVDTITVALSSGMFNVPLGQNLTLDNLAFNKTYYLGMQVSGDAQEMTPRQALAATPYALGSIGHFRVGKTLYVGSAAAVGSTSTALGNLSVSTGAGTAFYSQTTGSGGWAADLHNTYAGGDRYAKLAGSTYAATFMNGNVAIGTTTPSALFEIVLSQGVAAKIKSANNSLQLSVDDSTATYAGSTNTATWNATRLGAGTMPKLRLAGQGGLEFAVDAATVRAVVDTSGNMGVGDTTPSEGRLTVSAGTGVSVYSVNSGNSGWGGDFRNNDNGGNRYVQLAGGTLAAIFMNGSVGMGTSSPSSMLHVTGDVRGNSFISTSDMTLKKGILPLPEDTLQRTLRLRGVTFKWDSAAYRDKYAVSMLRPKMPAGQTSAPITPEEMASLDLGLSSSTQVGLLAQEVEAQFPELVHTDEQGGKAVDYGKFTAILLEAIKAQQTLINQLRQDVDKLKQQLP